MDRILHYTARALRLGCMHHAIPQLNIVSHNLLKGMLSDPLYVLVCEEIRRGEIAQESLACDPLYDLVRDEPIIGDK